ncbi:carbohydrate-responsive element-binding protein-like [Gigantopelta aegis]|uniref:carbohydrate-responsive element-binding protein-like n=1 Tax=Gigantopelta aegis TaxID=1735272 RepID=UPI001B88D34B|nr:carbohydrate-responsive element-binding protein-like [Gigantopelta aegis]
MSPSPDSSSRMTVHATTLKLKRKCGRPRNPIPRHKRESHISAEYRRRDKIQNGFQILKNIVPQNGEAHVIRDSKAEILFKAVDHSKRLQAEYKEQKMMISELQAEMKSLKLEIESQKNLAPDESVSEKKQATMEERLQEYIQERTKKNWRFKIFSFFIRPLFESYNSCVSQASLQSFISSVVDWASRKLTLTALRNVVFGCLLSTCNESSMMGYSSTVPEEAFIQTSSTLDILYPGDTSTMSNTPTDDFRIDLDQDKDSTLIPDANQDSTPIPDANQDLTLSCVVPEEPLFGSLAGIDGLLESDDTKDMSLNSLEFKDLAFGSLLSEDFTLGSSSCMDLSDLSLSPLVDKDFNLGTFVLGEPIYTPL